MKRRTLKQTSPADTRNEPDGGDDELVERAAETSWNHPGYPRKSSDGAVYPRAIARKHFPSPCLRSVKTEVLSKMILFGGDRCGIAWKITSPITTRNATTKGKRT